MAFVSKEDAERSKKWSYNYRRELHDGVPLFKPGDTVWQVFGEGHYCEQTIKKVVINEDSSVSYIFDQPPNITAWGEHIISYIPEHSLYPTQAAARYAAVQKLYRSTGYALDKAKDDHAKATERLADAGGYLTDEDIEFLRKVGEMK